jgi:hypothetical protein
MSEVVNASPTVGPAAQTASLDCRPILERKGADIWSHAAACNELCKSLQRLQHLVRAGYNVWYDKGIPGGSEWDAVLEQKLTGCFLVLLFVSQASIESKYVRREAKFADALKKPILSVKLEQANLTHGMGMLLTQYQMLSSSASDFHWQLGKAIQFLATRATTP